MTGRNSLYLSFWSRQECCLAAYCVLRAIPHPLSLTTIQKAFWSRSFCRPDVPPITHSLPLLQAVNPSGEGLATQVLPLQSSWSSASTGVRFRLMRSCISSSAFPDSDVHTLQLWGYAWRSGHLLVTGHVHTILVLTRVFLSVTQETPTAWWMSSFLFLSFSVLPSIHRSILISVLSRSPSSLLLKAHASAP